MVMNISSTTQNTAVAEPARRITSAGMESVGTFSTHQTHHEGSKISPEELAKKVMRLTGGIRLVSRPAQSWHHCGINE